MDELNVEQDERLEIVRVHSNPNRLGPIVGIALLTPVLVSSLWALAHGTAVAVAGGVTAGLSSWGLARLSRKLTDPCLRTTWFVDSKIGLGHIRDFKSRKVQVLDVAIEALAALKLRQGETWGVEARIRSGGSKLVMAGATREQAESYLRKANELLQKRQLSGVKLGAVESTTAQPGSRAEALAKTRASSRPGRSREELSGLRATLRRYDQEMASSGELHLELGRDFSQR